MRAKSHDQRKGQWLINKIRDKHDNVYGEDYARVIEYIIWNMENEDFDRLMEDYDK